MLYTAAPSTCPAGSNPVLRIAANSFVDRAEPQVPVRRISAIRSRATEGRPLPVRPSATAGPLSCRSGSGAFHTIPGQDTRADARHWVPSRTIATGVSAGSAGTGSAARSAVLRVPLLVAPADGFQRPLCVFLGRVGPEPVLGGADLTALHGVVLEAVVPVLFGVHED